MKLLCQAGVVSGWMMILLMGPRNGGYFFWNVIMEGTFSIYLTPKGQIPGAELRDRLRYG